MLMMNPIDHPLCLVHDHINVDHTPHGNGLKVLPSQEPLIGRFSQKTMKVVVLPGGTKIDQLRGNTHPCWVHPKSDFRKKIH